MLGSPRLLAPCLQRRLARGHILARGMAWPVLEVGHCCSASLMGSHSPPKSALGDYL